MTKHIILFLAANPLGTDRLALDEEARAIQEELERSGHRDQFELVTRWAVRPLDLLRALRKLKPTVVHFSGHGSRGITGESDADGPIRDVVEGGGLVDGEVHAGLFFQRANGRRQLVSAAALQETFGAAGTSVKVVVLNACYSEAQAEAIVERIDCVVGVSGAIGNDATRTFAIGFYGGLGDGESVATAFDQGRAAISLEGWHDSDLPQLHIRAGIDAGRLVLAARGDASTTAASGATERPASSAAPSTKTARPATSSRPRVKVAKAIMSWTRADVVFLTEIELEYAAVTDQAMPSTAALDEAQAVSMAAFELDFTVAAQPAEYPRVKSRVRWIGGLAIAAAAAMLVAVFSLDRSAALPAESLAEERLLEQPQLSMQIIEDEGWR